jgi:hypothetical protein
MIRMLIIVTPMTSKRFFHRASNEMLIESTLLNK